MRQIVLSVVLLCAGSSAALAAAPDSGLGPAAGRLMTLTLGRYQCERPAIPGQPGAVADAGASFAVTSSSRYVAADGTRGTYLFTGDTVTMTSGPLAGTRLVRLRGSFLRRIEDSGIPGDLRCVLSRSSDKH